MYIPIYYYVKDHLECNGYLDTSTITSVSITPTRPYRILANTNTGTGVIIHPDTFETKEASMKVVTTYADTFFGPSILTLHPELFI